MKKLGLILSLMSISYTLPSQANQYAVEGETMECRINGSNGIPATVFNGGPNERLKMTSVDNVTTIEVDYEPGQTQAVVTYNDTNKLNKLGYYVNFFDLGETGIKKTVMTSFILSGLKTEIVCNVRPEVSGVPIPPSPKIN